MFKQEEGGKVSQTTILGKRDNWIESAAVGLSFGCLVHCLALPLIIVLLPATASWLEMPESFHLWALLFALPVSLYMLITSRGRHGRHLPLIVGTGGLALMACGLLVGDDVLETWITSSGALLLAGSHIVNWRLRARHAHHRTPA